MLAWKVFFCLQMNGLPLIVANIEEILARKGDRVSLCCNISSAADSSVLWLYTPGEAYESVQHIYTDGRMLSRWRPRCLVTTNVTSSTLVLLSVHPNDAGYYECSDDRYDGIYSRLRVKLTVSTFDSSTELSRSSILITDRTIAWNGTTSWDQNATVIKGYPENLKLVSDDETFFSLANLNAFVMIGGIVFVVILVTVMLSALLAVALKKTVQQRNKRTRTTQDEMDVYSEIEATDINSTEQRDVEDVSSPHDYEEIPADTSAMRAQAVYKNLSEGTRQGILSPTQEYEEITSTRPVIRERQGRVHGAVSGNLRRNIRFRPPDNFSSINLEEISCISLPVIFPGPLYEQEDGQKEEYWPMVRDGYVEISQRPTIPNVVYEVLHPKEESQQKRTRLQLFRFFKRKRDER